jgi:large subunit ribosomal protein L25
MTKQTISLAAETRTVVGRKVAKLRLAGLVPANVFGKKIKSASIQVNTKEFLKVYDQAGETSLINLIIPGQPEKPVLVSAVQAHPVSGLLLHVDFHQVDLKEKVTATVPVELVGEAPASKDATMVLLQVISEIEVEALPTDIPNHFSADISQLAKIGDSLTVADLKIDLAKLTIKLSPEESVVLIQAQQAEVEPEIVAAPEGEGETEVEGEAETKAETKPSAQPEAASGESAAKTDSSKTT